MLKIFPLLILLISCSTPRLLETATNKECRKSLGRKITVKGKAVNAKLGALIILKDGSHIWIEGFDSWPEGYYKGHDDSITLEVTGKVIDKHDLPVFIKNDSISRSGIPVPEGTNLRKASRRYLLKDAKWKVVSD